MRNLLRFIINNQFALLFLLIETFSIILVIRSNKYQQAKYIYFSQRINDYFSDKSENILQYFSLKDINSQLVSENVDLKNELELYKHIYPDQKVFKKDTLYKQQYSYIIAKIVDNSVNKQYNYITLDKGILDGLKPDMAVISPYGVVGKIESLTDHYALVMSLLNRNLKISAKIKKNNYFGSFEWSGYNYRKATLNDIPLHVNISVGDTVITSGFSPVFPEGIMIGYITDFSIKGGSFYTINLRISNDFKNLFYVYVVINYYKEEKHLLDSIIKND